MAPNSSSVFNEAAAETKPSATATETPLTSTAPDTRPVTTASSASATMTTAASECTAKQAAPKMEQLLDDLEVSTSAASVADASNAAGLRFARVSPVGTLDDSKKTMVFRKSCLKRQSSFLPSALKDFHPEAIKVSKLDISTAHAEEATKEPQAPVQKNRRRCWECKAKVGLTAVTCRCDYTFCNKHRYAEEHNCQFNFKGAAKRKLEVENPRVVPAKVARIN